MPTATYYADRINMGACPGCDSFGRCSCDDEEAVDPELESMVEPPTVGDWEAQEEAHEVVVEGIMDGSIEPPEHTAREGWRRAA